MSVTLSTGVAYRTSTHPWRLTTIYRQPVDGEVQLTTLFCLLPLQTNIVAAYGRIERVNLDVDAFIWGKFRKYNDIKVRLLNK
jgi:hypothetical protein